jgi:hypothetical protein
VRDMNSKTNSGPSCAFPICASIAVVQRSSRQRKCSASFSPLREPIRYSEHLDRDGEKSSQNACRLALEGLVSKRKDGRYRSERNEGLGSRRRAAPSDLRCRRLGGGDLIMRANSSADSPRNDKKRLIARLALLQIKKPRSEPARRFARRSG